MINKHLLYDIANLQQRLMILYSNNVISCYDRIVHSIASLALQRLGILLPLLKSIFSTIQNMDYFIRMAFSDSVSKLRGLEETIPNQGILQGNRVGPIA